MPSLCHPPRDNPKTCSSTMWLYLKMSSCWSLITYFTSFKYDNFSQTVDLPFVLFLVFALRYNVFFFLKHVTFMLLCMYPSNKDKRVLPINSVLTIFTTDCTIHIKFRPFKHKIWQTDGYNKEPHGNTCSNIVTKPTVALDV